MSRSAAEKLVFHTEGMEFATEMIAEALYLSDSCVVKAKWL